MHEHTRPADPTVEVHLGALAVQADDTSDGDAEDTAVLAVNRALSMNAKPDDLELTQLTDTLVACCGSLAYRLKIIPESRRPQRGHGALRDWGQLRRDGPGEGPLAAWSYARQLSLVARNMIRALREHRQALPGQAPYVGRRDQSPLKPRTP
ncbi:hypothetical protein ACFWWS_03995 [Streptomyces sp. NPDC059083]|uniref:hypothetical protein n=1 Tax=unclassified Streptomyces TaxID=2593676 RepID=UPI003674ADB9